MMVERPLAFDNEIIHSYLESMKVAPEEYMALLAANVSERWNSVAKCFALPNLFESSIQVSTLYGEDGERNSDYQHLYPVIRRLQPDKWVFPRERIIYEPIYNLGMRYTYRPGRYKPAELIIRLPHRAKPYKWVLEPGRREPTYDSVGNNAASYIPVTNLSHMGLDDVYAVFDYFHRSDLHHEFPIKVFYKTHDQYLKLHALSIPLELLGIALNDKDYCSDDDDDDRRSN